MLCTLIGFVIYRLHRNLQVAQGCLPAAMSDLEKSWRALLTWMDEKHGWNSSDLKVEWKDVPGEL
jgi:hypothetical protein